MGLASEAISFLSHARAVMPNSSTTHYFCHCTKGDTEPRITVSIYDFGFWPKLKGSEKKVISSSEGLGALVFQMLVYKKAYQGLGVNSKGSSPIALFGFLGCPPGRKPSGETMWDRELRPQQFLNLPKPFRRCQWLQEDEEDSIAKTLCVLQALPAPRAVPVPTDTVSGMYL